MKLFLPYEKKGRYTLVQFSQILQQHATLEELDLNHGAIPLSGTPGAPVPFVLPRLVDLRLYGATETISGFIDFIGMSSPLHDVVVHFDYAPGLPIPALSRSLEKIIVAYYDYRGPNYARKIDTLTISSLSCNRHLAFSTSSRSPQTSNLELQFPWMGGHRCEEVLEGTFGLFPSSGA